MVISILSILAFHVHIRLFHHMNLPGSIALDFFCLCYLNVHCSRTVFSLINLTRLKAMTAVFCISVIFQIFCIHSFIYRKCVIITRGLYNSNPLFEGKNVFSKSFFFRKFCLYVNMISMKECFVIKSGFWWRVYGLLYIY